MAASEGTLKGRRVPWNLAKLIGHQFALGGQLATGGVMWSLLGSGSNFCGCVGSIRTDNRVLAMAKPISYDYGALNSEHTGDVLKI